MPAGVGWGPGLGRGASGTHTGQAWGVMSMGSVPVCPKEQARVLLEPQSSRSAAVAHLPPAAVVTRQADGRGDGDDIAGSAEDRGQGAPSRLTGGPSEVSCRRCWQVVWAQRQPQREPCAGTEGSRGAVL